jgi:hypothetical protein
MCKVGKGVIAASLATMVTELQIRQKTSPIANRLT